MKMFHPMNVHLCANVFNFFLQIITSSGVDKNGVFYTWKCFLPEEYIPNCVIWLKQCFLHLKMSSIWRIYTSVRVFFNFFSWRIFTSVRADYNGIYTWKCYLPEEYTPLCECFFNFFIEEYPLLCELTKIIFSTLKNCLQHEIYIPLSECFSIFQWRIFTSVRVD